MQLVAMNDDKLNAMMCETLVALQTELAFLRYLKSAFFVSKNSQNTESLTQETVNKVVNLNWWTDVYYL